MEENKYFTQALHNFTFDVACGDAIKHLHKLGFSATEIKSKLNYPVSIEQIERYIKDYEKKSGESVSYEFIREEDEFGRKTFRRVPKDIM